jgi:hypothetical protein
MIKRKRRLISIEKFHRLFFNFRGTQPIPARGRKTEKKPTKK